MLGPHRILAGELAGAVHDRVCKGGQCTLVMRPSTDVPAPIAAGVAQSLRYQGSARVQAKAVENVERHERKVRPPLYFSIGTLSEKLHVI
mmetsp:Transcript_26625/g.36876  ORF Transcript_26625/g.36876 Transcript_26625/m.36876 type:complete len:90 (+) Transcript_26625:605-874(+)